MNTQRLDLKDKNQVTQLFSELEPLVQQHKLKELLDKTLDILQYLNVLVDDKVIAVDAEEHNEKYESYIIIRIYTMHGLKVVLRVNKSGFIVRWVEGISNCETYCQ